MYVRVLVWVWLFDDILRIIYVLSARYPQQYEKFEYAWGRAWAAHGTNIMYYGSNETMNPDIWYPDRAVLEKK